MKCRTIAVMVAGGAMALAFSTANAAEFLMKMANGPGPLKNHYSHTAQFAFEKEVEEKSNGRIDVKFFWNFALGKNEKVLNLLRTGSVEGIVTSEGHLAPYFPNVQVLGVPYLFINRKVAWEVLDGPVGQEINERIAKEAGIRVLGWFENGGYRHYSSGKKPLKTVDDLKGMKIRTMTNPVHMEIVRSLGASPTPISWPDLYAALQTGVVEGQENSLATFRIPKLEEVQKHIILDGHVYSLNGFFISEKWFQSLPPDLQEIVTEAGRNATAVNRKVSVANFETDRKYLEGKGVSIVDVSAAEKKRFQDATQKPALDMLRKEVDTELLDKVLNAVKEAEAKHL